MFKVYNRVYSGRETLIASFKFYFEAEEYVFIKHKKTSDRYTIRREEV